MTKEQLRKNWRRGFAVALTAAMVANSTLPATTFAAEFTASDEIAQTLTENKTENTQVNNESGAFGDGEENTEDIFSTGTENASSAQTSGTELSEAIKAMQKRINALPTVEEFETMADGTTVEDSNLNQKQTDVYNEAQAIVDALDQLSEEEQGQVDTSKLEALFEYFNSMTDETATTISPVTSGSKYINSGGTYTLKGGTYSTSANSIVINTTEAVTLNIDGDITAKSSSNAFINAQKACSNLTINGNGHTINANNANVIVCKSSANITIKGGIYTATTNTGRPVIASTGGGTLSIYDATVKVTGSSDAGQAINNDGSTLNIYSGIIDNGPQAKYTCIFGGTVNMYGGIITAQAKNSPAINAATVNFTGGTIKNSLYGIHVSNTSNVTIGADATFTNNTGDISLASGKQFTIKDDFKGTASVRVVDIISDNTKRQITTTGTSQDMLKKVTPVDSSYTINYDTSGKYLYMWKHSHTWSYSASENTVTAKCTSDPDCGYTSGVTLTLNAPDMPYSGAAYTAASVKNNITSVTTATADSIKYVGRDGTSYTESTTAPTNAGKYTAKVTISGQTASVDFEITKAKVTAPVADSTNFVYNGQQQTYNIADSNLYTVTGNTQTDAGTYTVTVSLKDKTNSEWADGSTDDLEYTFKIAKAESAATVTPVQDLIYANDALPLVNEENITGGTVYYRIGTDGEWTQNPPTATDAGEYEVFYYVKGDANHEDKGSENEPLGSCKVTIAKKQIEASADGFEGVYDENVSHTIQVTVTNPAEGYKITYSTTGEEGSYTEENPAITEVGEHTVYYRVEAGNNYRAAEGSAAVKITGAAFAEGDITAVGYEGTYDGASHKISVETKGTAAGAKITYSTTGEADSYTDAAPEFKNATDGSQTVYYKVSKKGYSDVRGSVEVSIARKNVPAVVSVKEKVYDGTTEADVEATVDTGIENENLTVSGVTGTFTSKDAAENIDVSVNSSEMTVTAGVGTNADNYSVSCEEKASGKITAKPVTVIIIPNGGTYGSVKGAEAALQGVMETDQGSIPVKLTYTGKDYDSTDVPTQAGTYNVTASIENGNYVLEGTKIAEFIIAKAEVTAPVIASKQYTGETQTADVEDTDFYTVTKNEGGQKVGDYPVVFTLKDSVNYKWETTEKADLELTFSIIPIDNGWITEPSISGWTYGNQANAPEGAAKHGLVSVTYAKEGSDKFTSEVPTEAGNYKARFNVEGTDSYSELSKDVSFTITARPVTVKVNDKSITYGDAEPEYASKITEGSLVGKDDLKLTYSREKGTAAKTYTITAASANSNYKVSVNPGTLTIQKKDLTVTPEKAAKVYGDADPQIPYSVSGLVKGEKKEDVLTGTLARIAGENKGTYAYEIGSLADVSGNYNVTLDEKAAVFTITAKAVTLTWSKTALTYTGAEQSVTAQVSNPAGTDTFKLKYKGNTAVDAGNYKAEVTALGNDNYVLTENSNQKTDWSIAKADVQYQLPEANSGLTYNGKDQELVKAGNATGGIWMYKVGDGAWSEELPAGLDAGTYTISYKVTGDKNHNDSTEGQLTVTIARRAVTVSGIKAEDKTYDGNTSAVLDLDKVKFDGIVEKDSLSVTASGTFEDKNAGEKKVLISNLVLDGASAKNYVLAEGQQSEAASTIHAKEITVEITPNGGTYEGTITPAIAILNGLVGKENPEITLTYTGTANDGTKADGKVPTHAGTYTVTASITDGNYSLKAEGASAEFVVAKADPALSVSAIADKNYGEEAFKLETSNKGDGQKSYTSSDAKVVAVDENGLVTIVGAGKATLTVFLAESANYDAGEKTVTVTVKKIDRKLTVEKLAYEVTYGDPSFKIAANAGDKEADIKYASSDKDVASVSKDGTVTVGNVGTAKIKVSMDESQNYLTAAKEVTVTVIPKEVTVTPDSAEKHVGKNDQEKFTYKVDGLVGKDTLKGITVTRKEGEDPGKYDITASVDKNASNSNYKITLEKGTFTINDHDWSGEWKTVREATSWSEGKKEKTCAFDGCEQKKYETIPKTGEKEDPNDKKLEKDAEVAPGSPISQVSLDSSKSELLAAPKIFTEKERTEISAGNVNARVWVEVTPVNKETDLTPEEIAAIEKEAEKLTGKDSEIVYFNANLFKQVDGGEKTQIKDPGTKIKITIRIPEELLNHQSYTIRDYKIIRMHNGQAEVLSGTFNSTTKEFTFETDKFSTYAISYKDTYYSPSYPVTGVTVSPEKATLTKEGETVQLKETITPSYADNKNVTWTSSDEKVATVDKNGKVTAVSNGTAVITVISVDGKYTAKTTITVKITPEKLTLTAEKTTLTKIGDSLQITAKVEPDNAYKKLIWKSSDEKVAIVDSDGKVTAVGTGTATITATTEDGKLTESVTITVKIPDEPTVNETTGYGRLKARSVTQTNNSIKLEWTRVSGADGYIIYGNYCNGNGKVYKYNKITTITNGKTRTWTHTKLKKATYYKYIVKAYKLVNGKKVITDTSVSVHATTTGGKYGVAKAVSITKIGNKKNVTKVTLKKGKTAQITAKEIKKDKPIKHHRNICYESSNTKVATVTPNGMIQANGKGTCTIWVYAQNGVYKAVTVTVK